MPRPASYRDQPHDRCCGTCRYAHLIAYKNDLLCFFGDRIETTKSTTEGWEFVEFNGLDLSLADGDEYDQVWGGRSVDPENVCNEWVAEGA